MELKKLLFKTLRFILILIVLDFALGQLFETLYFNQKGGKLYRSLYSIEKAEADLLIFGNSYATKHYDPTVFEEGLNVSVYNTGALGQGILYVSAIQELILKRFTPKKIIINVDDEMLGVNDNEYDRLAVLFPYVKKHSELEQTLLLKDDNLKWKLKSNLYRYNSTLVHILASGLIEQKDYKGFVPQRGQISEERFAEYLKRKRKPVVDFDLNKVKALQGFVERSKQKNVDVIFVVAPRIDPFEDKETVSQKTKEIAKQYDLPIFDYSQDKRFVSQRELFADAGHLNREGARLFSQILTKKLK